MHDRCMLRAGTLIIRPLPGCRGLLLAGEADLNTRDTLRAGLAALPADDTGELHLELAALQFIDVACARELIALTWRHPAARVVAHHPPDSLLRITALLYSDAPIEFTGTFRLPAPAVAGYLAAHRDGRGCMSDGSWMPVRHADPRAMPEADVIDLISGDHDKLLGLFASLPQLTCKRQHTADACRHMLGETWAALARLLATHLDAEQEICYPAIAAAKPAGGALPASAVDHFDIREALAEARLSVTGSTRWLRAVTDAWLAAIRHCEADHNHLLPVLGQATPEGRRLLGRQWAAFTLARLLDEAEADAAGR
jgi:Hemerythrin HHE cation binding domain